MNLSDETLIQQEATLIRRALEQIAYTLEGLQSFPRGACGNASVLLGEWLIRKGFEGIEYVSGSSDEFKTHAWLECDGLIIDITADQFDMGMPPVFVSRDRSFHNQFQVSARCDKMVESAIEQVNFAALEKRLDRRPPLLSVMFLIIDI